MNYSLIIIPLLAAFTGWAVIWLIAKMLFRPLHPKKIAGYSWQGMLPARKEQIADKIGKLVAGEFASFASIEQKISDPKNFEKVKPLIETHIDDFLRNKLKEQMPMISMFIGDKTISSLKTIFIKEIETLFPMVMQQFAGNLKNELNLEQKVSSRINTFSPEQIESLIYKKMIQEIRIASWLGAVIGLLIGMIQLSILLLTD